MKTAFFISRIVIALVALVMSALLTNTMMPGALSQWFWWVAAPILLLLLLPIAEGFISRLPTWE